MYQQQPQYEPQYESQYEPVQYAPAQYKKLKVVKEKKPEQDFSKIPGTPGVDYPIYQYVTINILTNNLSNSQFLWVFNFLDFFTLIVKCHKPTLIAQKFQLSLDNMLMLKLVAKHIMSVMKMEEVAKKDQNSFAQMEQSTTKR